MSTIAVNAITDASGGTTASINGYTPTISNMAGRNRIINGAMVIDQRNAGASVSVQTTTTYTLDRWAVLAAASSKYTVQQNAGAVTPPAGYAGYLGVTSSAATTPSATDQYLVRQGIEGFNGSDLAWGTVDAKSVTLSFWVRSSLTGTFGGSLNGGGGGSTYSYPFTYTINAANTWEQKTITIAGQTAGTWAKDNTLFTWVAFGLGVGSTYSGTANTWANAYYASATGATNVIGTNGATFYITGVQLEKGSTASAFDYRPYGTELALCQRYYATGNYPVMRNFTGASIAVSTSVSLPVTMRATPTVTASVGTVETAYSNVISSYQTSIGSGASTATSTYTAAIEL